MAAPKIFRQAALERLSTPEQLDQIIQVTSSKGWLSVTVVGLLLGLAMAWAWFGTISKKVEGVGILRNPGGVQTVAAPISGVLAELPVETGDRIKADQSVALIEQRVEALRPKLREQVRSPYAGRVLEVLANVGTFTTTGSPLFLIEPEGDALEMLAFVPTGAGKRIRAGMEAQVSPSAVKREEFGFIRGRVTGVSQEAVTREGMMRTIGNEMVVSDILKLGPVLALKVEMQTDADAPSGFRWSSSQGPPQRLSSGTPCTVQFIVERTRPVSLVIPKLREMTGSY